jgi:hypothetical protein
MPPKDARTKKLARGAGTRRPTATESTKEPQVISTICGRCADRFAAYRKPVLVVGQRWARMYDELVEMFKSRPDIQVVLDRRRPAGAAKKAIGWNGPDRRRRKNSLILQ